VSFGLDNVSRHTARCRLLDNVKWAGLLGLAMLVLAPDTTQTAVANGDTRSISLYHAHRKDSLVVTFRRNGSLDSAALKQLNYFLRDWRNDEQIRMDPRLFDVIWEAQRMVGSRGKITVLSSYRSPRTNSMLRSRSRGVAKNSQHMYGRAMDLRISGANMSRVREAAMKLQRGGVGWYSSRFVHIDVGSVRAWPRMSYSQLARLFPDGKTVHIAANGRTLPGYEEARQMVASRNGAYVPTLAQVQDKGFLARLFGWGDSGDEADQSQARRQVARAPLGRTGRAQYEDTTSAASFFRRDAALRNGGSTNVRVAARPAAPVKSAARVNPVVNSTVSAAAEKPQPAPRPRAAEPEERIIVAPVAPSRPNDTKIAALIQSAAGPLEASGESAGASETPSVPVPPQRPGNLIVVAEHAAPQAVPLPPDSRGRLAALIGLNGAGAIGSKHNLPDVITKGTSVAAHAGAPDIMAFANPASVSPDMGKATSARRSHGMKVHKLALRRSLPATPAIARTVGMRAASLEAPANLLVAARFDRSNFNLLTRPQSLANGNVNALMGSAIAPLRSAARFSRETLIFAEQDQMQMQFVVTERRTALNATKFVTAR
jgi:uncharacterized protein YcbK (DUF882 family)